MVAGFASHLDSPNGREEHLAEGNHLVLQKEVNMARLDTIVVAEVAAVDSCTGVPAAD